MKFRLSILNVYVVMLLIACIIFTIINYGELSRGEGWGLVGMVGVFGFGIVLFVVDIVIHNIFKKRSVANIAGFMVAVAATLVLRFGGLF